MALINKNKIPKNSKIKDISVMEKGIQENKALEIEPKKREKPRVKASHISTLFLRIDKTTKEMIRNNKTARRMIKFKCFFI